MDVLDQVFEPKPPVEERQDGALYEVWSRTGKLLDCRPTMVAAERLLDSSFNALCIVKVLDGVRKVVRKREELAT